MTWYTLLVLAVAAERLAELRIARRNARWILARGGREYGRGHYPAMVLLHTGLLAGCLAEVWAADRPFVPAVGVPMLAVVLAAQGLRWWCVGTLGPRWNTRVIVVPGLPLVARGPYGRLRHPNYVAVAAEGAALPLVHGGWLTALVFTVLNAALLTVRIHCEDAALTGPAKAGASTPTAAADAGRAAAAGTAVAPESAESGTPASSAPTPSAPNPSAPNPSAPPAGPAPAEGVRK